MASIIFFIIICSICAYEAGQRKGREKERNSRIPIEQLKTYWKKEWEKENKK